MHGRERESCQNVTVVDLLSMTSGILPSDMGACEDVPNSGEWTPDEWYWEYRYAAPASVGYSATHGDRAPGVTSHRVAIARAEFGDLSGHMPICARVQGVQRQSPTDSVYARIRVHAGAHRMASLPFLTGTAA